jgi:hypothetical protein
MTMPAAVTDCNLIVVYVLLTLPECLSGSAQPAFVVNLQRNVTMLAFNQCLDVPSVAAFVAFHVHSCTFFSLLSKFLE